MRLCNAKYNQKVFKMSTSKQLWWSVRMDQCQNWVQVTWCARTFLFFALNLKKKKSNHFVHSISAGRGHIFDTAKCLWTVGIHQNIPGERNVQKDSLITIRNVLTRQNKKHLLGCNDWIYYCAKSIHNIEMAFSQWQRRNDFKIIDIPVSHCPHSYQTAQQKTPQRQFRTAIPYLQNLHFNNLAMYTVQRSKHKHTSFTKK